MEEELFHNIKKKCNTNLPAILHGDFVHVGVLDSATI